MSYNVLVEAAAARDMQRLPRQAFAAALKILLSLGAEPRPATAGNLTGVPGGMKQRTGDYRILYVVNDSDRTVTVYRIANRREAYQ